MYKPAEALYQATMLDDDSTRAPVVLVCDRVWLRRVHCPPNLSSTTTAIHPRLSYAYSGRNTILVTTHPHISLYERRVCLTANRHRHVQSTDYTTSATADT